MIVPASPMPATCAPTPVPPRSPGRPARAWWSCSEKVKNQRLAAASYIWTFAALTASPYARAHYDRRRDTGDGHAAALRNLFNKFLGQLHHCLATGQRYDPNHAFPNIESTATAA